MLIVVGGIKGGTGKTTIATNLAVCAALNGNKVLLVDADEQQSATDWAAQREGNGLSEITTISLLGKSVHSQLMRLKEDFDEIIVDTGGRDTTSQRSALVVCDLLIVPFRPRSLDIWTVGSLKKLQEEIQAVNVKFKLMAVINQSDPTGSDPELAKRILQDQKVDHLDIEIGNRKAFSNAAAKGLGVVELKTSDEKSCQEVLELHDVIYQGNMRKIYDSNGIDI